MNRIAGFATALLLLLAGVGCGSVSGNPDAAATGGSSPSGGATGTGGSGGAAVHVCSADATCSRCPSAVCCGSTCCGPGEWCDTSGTAPICRCGGGDACTDGNSCSAPVVNTSNPCGVVCCQGSGCPVSRRAYKRDIQPLDRAEIDRVYAQLRDIKLTTYQYKSEPPSAPRRLGFIIDDTKSSYPVNGDGNSVNLYGYVSMAVAAIQAQSEEIAALRAEVVQLRRDARRAAASQTRKRP
ncbi:MAG TPA: tail fiber domain-containing protein [Polyangia bacterium]|nr:tail fiber domain-containing protein [Polyangia bacterium]